MAKTSKMILVLLESLAGTGTKVHWIRPRVDDKLEMIRFDKKIRQYVLFREVKKIKSMKH